MAQSEVKQEAQFKVYGADCVKFTVDRVDSETGRVYVTVKCDELKKESYEMEVDACSFNDDEPVRLQLANDVFNYVRQLKDQERDLTQTLNGFNNLRGQEQTVTASELEVHQCEMHKLQANHFDPLLTQTQITTIFHEDDFDFQFEQLQQQLAEMDEAE